MAARLSGSSAALRANVLSAQRGRVARLSLAHVFFDAWHPAEQRKRAGVRRGVLLGERPSLLSWSDGAHPAALDMRALTRTRA